MVNIIWGGDSNSIEDLLDRLGDKIKERINTNTNIRDIDEGTLFESEVDDIIKEFKHEELNSK